MTGTGAISVPKEKIDSVGRVRQFGKFDPRILKLGFIVLVLGGILFRLVEVWRPIDQSTRVSWRECDEGSMARNFWRGDMNILYPQIDWRRDGDGYVESEFPLLPWFIALGYKAFGYHEVLGRMLAAAASLLSLFAFYRLGQKLLPSFQAKCALVFFAYSPVLVDFADNIQPDVFMLLFVILAIYFLVDWIERERSRDLMLCGVFGALAILLKLPAIYIGLVCALVVLEKHGARAFQNPKVWALMLMMVVPPLLWYWHAHRFWKLYGNSLGISNETHWLGMDMLRNPKLFAKFMYHMLRIEFRKVFGIVGLVLAWFGLSRSIHERRIIAYWALAALCFYIVALRTTADDWAIYYHYLSIPPACLLMGWGCSPFELAAPPAGELKSRLAMKNWALGVVSILALGLFVLQSVRAVELPFIEKNTFIDGEYRAAKQFAPQLESDALVVTLGGPCTDDTGRPVASDNPAMLFWMDRKGFSICEQEVSLNAIVLARDRGGKYFAGKPDEELGAELKRNFRLIDQSDSFVLFALR